MSLVKRAKKLGRKITGWGDRIDAATKKVDDLGKKIDPLDTRLKRTVEEADAARRKGDFDKSKRLDAEALHLSERVGGLKEKRRFWVGRVKQLRIEKKGFVKAKQELEEAIDKLPKKVKINVEANKVTGGNAKERWIAACLASAQRCAAGQRANFYSQPGTYTTDACFTGEAWGERSDCSQWVTSVARAAGLDDPNGTNWTGGGFTGTLLQANGKWRETDRDTFIKRGWGYVVYGSGNGFHTEAYIGGTKTIGHGDSQINEGFLDMFSPRRYFVYG